AGRAGQSHRHLLARVPAHERRLRRARVPGHRAGAGPETMKAIIVAAGRGRRLGVETDLIPKCMVKVGGRPILHWQLDALAAAGEFTGLARFAPAGAAALRAVWAEAGTRGLDAPFGAAAALRQAYLSDGLNAVADRGVTLGAVLVDGGWREIDTEQDLARAEL